MRKLVLLSVMSIFFMGLSAQVEGLEVDQSLIVNVMKVTDKGYISIKDLQKATGIGINETDAKVISYTFSWMGDGNTMVEMKMDGTEFSEALRMRIKEFKIGTKFYIDQIIVENSSGRVTAKPAKLTVKS